MSEKKACRWIEVDKVKDENRHELVLTGDDVSARLAENGVDERIYRLANLNFLEISKTTLDVLSDGVGELENLFHLVLRCNKLRELPVAISRLKKLKLLDVSNNELTSIPDEIGSLKELQTLNASCNKLDAFCDVSGMVQLHELDVSHNQLCSLPPGVTCSELSNLSTVRANNNQVTELPSDLSELPSLKLLDVTANRLAAIPAELAECGKLKELKVSGNPLKDKRLLKMVDQCATKSVLDYLRNILEKERKASGGKEGKDKKDKKKKGGKGKNAEVDDTPQNAMKVLHFNADSGLIVTITANVQTVRPYIVCCIVRNLNFPKSKSMMKRFLLLQTKLHDGICAKRQAATIATHDLDLVKAPLTYDAQPPDELKIWPLGKIKEVSTAALVARLRREADELRKEKKRNTISGIHKYLDLLKDKSLYPCVTDSSNVTISFPPITNSNVTRVSSKTRHILVEVTSSQNLAICKKVMDEFLGGLLKMGIGLAELPQEDAGAASEKKTSDPLREIATEIDAAAVDASGDGDAEEEGDGEIVEDDEELPATSEQILVLEQVKIVDHLGTLKVIYPSRVDLESAEYRVIRDYE